MLQINPKKFKHIQNKTIPSPLRPKFRNKSETNIYFLSKKKVNKNKKDNNFQRLIIIFTISIVIIGSYILLN